MTDIAVAPPQSTPTTERPPFKVADLSPETVRWGRNEIRLAEQEMPGLMAARAEYGPDQPLAGLKVAGSLHMTIQTAVLIETLADLGADVRRAVGVVQHLLDAGPRRGGGRGRSGRHAGRPERLGRVRVEG
jgi:hypothetical protein